MSVICIGDSLTYGKVGYSYIPFLKTTERIVNKGVNGDTTCCAYKRLERILRNPEYEAAGTYIVGIGTNDILFPYLTSLSFLWRFQTAWRSKVKKCITNNKKFAQEYERYITLLRKHQKKIILLGLPYIQLEHYPLAIVRKRNAVIRKLAEIYGCSFVDTYSEQLKIVPHPKEYSWKGIYLSRLLDSAVMTAIPFTKRFYTNSRKLVLTVDGVHYTKRSAEVIADCINKYLRRENNNGI